MNVIAQVFGGYSIGQIVLMIIVAVGVISILVAFLRARQIAIPAEFVTYAWIVLGVIVAALAVIIILGVARSGGIIGAIKILMGMM